MKPRFQVRWTQTAERDLGEIALFIAAENRDRALEAVVRVQERARDLEYAPEQGPLVPELLAQGSTMYRELVIKPWRLVYRIEVGDVLVLAFLDSRRNMEDLLLERFLR